MKRFLWILILIYLSSCARSNVLGTGKGYDVALEVSPQTVSLIERHVRVDAIEDPEIQKDQPISIVTFKVHKVLRGDFSERRGGPSQFEQMKRAASDRQFLKLLTLDFKSPGDIVQRDFLRIAVANPTDTFGITSWETPERDHLKIYLKRDAQNPSNYILTDVKV